MTLSELSGQLSSGYLFAQKQPSIFDSMMLPIVAIALLFFFMIFLPDKRRRRQQEEWAEWGTWVRSAA